MDDMMNINTIKHVDMSMLCPLFNAHNIYFTDTLYIYIYVKILIFDQFP